MDEPALDRMQKRLAFNAENAEIENNPSRARHYREILEALAGLRAERDAAMAALIVVGAKTFGLSESESRERARIAVDAWLGSPDAARALARGEIAIADAVREVTTHGEAKTDG